MSLYYINTGELIIKPTNSHKLWVNYWVKKSGFKIEENKPYKCPACKKIFSGRTLWTFDVAVWNGVFIYKRINVCKVINFFVKCKCLKFTCYSKEARCSNGTDKWPFFSILNGIASLSGDWCHCWWSVSRLWGGENRLLNMANMSDYYFTWKFLAAGVAVMMQRLLYTSTAARQCDRKFSIAKVTSSAFLLQCAAICDTL